MGDVCQALIGIAGKSVNADEMIGSLKIGVPSVVRNDRLCDFWALQVHPPPPGFFRCVMLVRFPQVVVC